MLVQYLVLLGATNLQKLKRRSEKAVNSPKASRERIFHVHMLVESLCIIVQQYILQQSFSLNLVLHVFLIFHQNSGSCSYKIVLVMEIVYPKGIFAWTILVQHLRTRSY